MTSFVQIAPDEFLRFDAIKLFRVVESTEGAGPQHSVQYVTTGGQTGFFSTTFGKREEALRYIDTLVAGGGTPGKTILTVAADASAADEGFVKVIVPRARNRARTTRPHTLN